MRQCHADNLGVFLCPTRAPNKGQLFPKISHDSIRKVREQTIHF